jgi:hypothetical protein
MSASASGDRPAPDPAGGGEIKLIELVVKRPDISDERFHYHWKVIHGPLGRAMKHLVRYVQLHRIHPYLPGLPPIDCEGIVEGWFLSRQTLQQTFAEPTVLERTKPDEPLFLDVDRLTPILAAGEEIVPGALERPAGAKAALLLRRPEGVELAEFRARSREFAVRVAAATGVQHASHDVALDSEYDDGAQPPYDSFVFITWPDALALEAAWQQPATRSLLGEIGAFADFPRSAGFLAEEHRVTWPSEAGERKG